MRIIYTINGTDLATLGITVTAADGLLDLPAPRERTKQEWSDMHGDMISHSAPTYGSRSIELHCTMVCPTPEFFIQASRTLHNLFFCGDLLRLVVTIGSKSLYYLVYLNGEIEYGRKWAGGQILASFTLHLCEPEPFKRIYKATAKSVTLTVSKCATPVNVYWGNERTSIDYDMGVGSITHTFSDYADKKEHIVIITGDIHNLTSNMTNSTLVWNLL